MNFCLRIHFLVVGLCVTLQGAEGHSEPLKLGSGRFHFNEMTQAPREQEQLLVDAAARLVGEQEVEATPDVTCAANVNALLDYLIWFAKNRSEMVSYKHLLSVMRLAGNDSFCVKAFKFVGFYLLSYKENDVAISTVLIDFWEEVESNENEGERDSDRETLQTIFFPMAVLLSRATRITFSDLTWQSLHDVLECGKLRGLDDAECEMVLGLISAILESAAEAGEGAGAAAGAV